MQLKSQAGDSFLRCRDITRDRQRGTPGIVGVGPSTWWAWVRSGRAPQPIRLSSGVTVWRASDIQRFIEEGAQ